MQTYVIEKTAFEALIRRIEELEYLYDLSVEEMARDRLYSTGEAAEILGVCRVTLQKYRDEGLIGFAQCGQKIYFRWEDIEAFIEQHRKR